MAIEILIAAGAASATALCKPIVLVTLVNGSLIDPVVSAVAQGAATRIYAQVGVKLVWRINDPPPTLPPCVQAVRIVLETCADPRFSPLAMGYATVGAAGATDIHVFYDRVTGGHRSQLVPTLLGHTFAHEIAHVLENLARHSATGVLKANWAHDDFDEMQRHPLPFAAEDAEMIRGRFRF